MRVTYVGVLVAVILVVGACGATNQPSSSQALVEITVGTDIGAELNFEPREVSVPAGADVRLSFENRSTVPHNLTFQRPPDVATSTVVAAGASETLEFKAPDPGEYAFVCTLHPGMAGTLLVEGG